MHKVKNYVSVDMPCCPEVFLIDIYKNLDVLECTSEFRSRLCTEIICWVDNTAALNNGLDVIDSALFNFAPEKASNLAAVAFIRYTYRFRDNLKHWHSCVKRIASHMESIGVNYKFKLRGLL